MSGNVRLASRFSRDLELMEIDVWNGFYKYADRETVRSCGIDLDHDEMLSILIASKLDILAMNRVLGLGLGEPADDDHIKNIISRYKDAGVPRFFVQLHPLAQPEKLPEMLTEHGFSLYNNWVKLYREIEAPLPEPSDLEIRQIRPMISSAIGKPGWYFYMAYDNGTPIATGANYIDGRYCWIDFAATLAEHRGKGAQTALAVRRIRDAEEQGCKWLVVETAEQTAEKEAPSYRNMIRLGFKVAYVRPNYIMKF
jgi:hypothetical protein